MITRRGFLGLLGGLVAAEVARPIYILPPMGGWSRTDSGLLAQSQAIEMEWVMPEFEDLIISGSTLWEKMLPRKEILWNRSYRIPLTGGLGWQRL